MENIHILVVIFILGILDVFIDFNKMKKSFTILSLIVISSCFFNPKIEGGVKKEVVLGEHTFEWKEFSSAYSDGPDLILCCENNFCDTICKATNITDIFLREDKLVIESYGLLALYNKPLKNLVDECGKFEVLFEEKN